MSKCKKIFAIIMLTLIVLLVAATIVLAVVPKQYYDAVYDSANGTVSNITVYHNGKNNSYFSDSEEYGKIVELYKKSSKENLLLSLFEGTLGAEPTIESYSTTLTLNNSENTYVAFKFSSTQTLKFKGETYKNTSGNSITFNAIVVSIGNDSNNLANVNVYICTSVAGSSAVPQYKITTLAKQHELLTHIESLELN